MIQETIDAVADAIDGGLAAALIALPGFGAAALQRGGTVMVSRDVLDPAMYEDHGIGVRVEQQDAVSVSYPYAGQEELETVSVGVTCWLHRARISGLTNSSDDEMIRAVRALCRAADMSLRGAFASATGRVLTRDGVQVRAPVSVVFGEPEQGEDAALTLMTISYTVPALDYVARSAGSM